MRRINGQPFNHTGEYDMPKLKTIGTGVGVIFLINIAIMIAVVCGLVWGCNKIKDKGLKGCVESVWSGPATNALPEDAITE